MSRIWEALKKAEAQKGQTPPGREADLSLQDAQSGVPTEAEREYVLMMKQIEATLQTPGATVLAVASPSAGAGTSTVASGLACVVAATRGKKVLLVDANFRAPGFGDRISNLERPGLAEVLSGRKTIADVVFSSRIPTLSIMVAGTEGRSIAVLLEGDKVESFVKKVRTDYQVVLLDCPPIISCAETMTVASNCDGTILVAEWGRTKREVADRAKGILEEAGAKIVGIVLNRRKYIIPEVLYRLL